MGDSPALWPFEVAAALKILQQWGVELLESNFYPLSSEQADEYYADSGESEATGPWFGIQQPGLDTMVSEVLVVNAQQKAALISAVSYVYKQTEIHPELSFKERLMYVRKSLPGGLK